MRIAIWGSTGHIGQTLIHEARIRGIDCHGYVRDLAKASQLLPEGSYSHFDNFPSHKYDLLVNAIAAGPTGSRGLFEVLERWDWRMIDFARENPQCTCVNISSGAVYGEGFASPADEDSSFVLSPNRIEEVQRYGLIKLMCEQRHRAHAELPLVDLRVFSFFTRYIDLSQPFFMTDVFKAVRDQTTLITQPNDFERDFIHPKDFLNLILLCAAKKVNGFYDVYSRDPIKKSEIISSFTERYGLKSEHGGAWTSLTGAKARYFSKNCKAAELGYSPVYSSADVLTEETDIMLQH